jgi:hypothetical protein
VVTKLIVALLLSMCPAASALSQTAEAPADSTFNPNLKPTLQISRAPGPITLDGELDDPGWVGAARATGFSETFPEERGRPPVESEVLVTYDEKHLYLAFIARDDPPTLRASLRDRDEMWSDDYFGILLDTYGDAAWAYFLFANPLGVQGDSRFATSSGEDDGFDIVYETEAKVTDAGYQIEMAIPFESLRFPDRPVQTWRATFWRTRPRESRATYSWAAMDRDESCFLCQFGMLAGIEGVEPGGAVELFPAVVGSHAGALEDSEDPEAGFADDGFDGEGSLGLRYAFPAGLTAEATFNPDFSQVESDVAQVDVNETFALFFPERRPFFQEGSDLFDTWVSAVYTRQINDPQVAVKLIGRLGRTSVAYLGGRDENSPILLPFEERSFVGQAGESISNVLRFRQTFLENSYVGALLTDRRLEDGDGAGTTFGVDGIYRFLDKYQVEYQILGSRTNEPDDPTLTEDVNELAFNQGAHTAAFDGETFSGYAQYTSLERSARFWNFDFDYWASSPTFRADNGFEFRNDFRRASMFQGLNFYPGTKLIDRVSPNVFVQRTWNFDGVRKTDFLRPQVEFNLTRQTFVSVGHDWGRERFANIEFSGIRSWDVFVESNFSDPVRLGFYVSHGREIARNTDPPVLGTGTDLELFGTFKPLRRLILEPSFRYSELHEPKGGPEIFSGYILRTRGTFSLSRELLLRLVLQYDDFAEVLNVEPLVTYQINPFTLFYLGSTHVYRDFEEPHGLAEASRQFFLKFQYLVQL